MRPIQPLCFALIALLGACSSQPEYIKDGWLDVQQSLSQGSSDQTPREDPEKSLLYQLLVGEIAGRKGDLPMALSSYSAAALQSQDPRVAARATQLAVYAGDWPKARRSGEHWRSLAPESVEAHRLLSAAYLRTGDNAKASEALSQVVKLSAQDVDTALRGITVHLLREKDQEAAMDVIRLVAKQYPNRTSAHYGLAQIALKNDELDTAIEALNAVLAIDPNASQAINLLAKARLQTEQYDQGIQELRAFITREPTNVEAQVSLAQLLLAAKRYDEAEAQLDRIFTDTQDSPQRGQIAYSLGIWAFEAERYQAAQRYLQAAVDSDTNVDEASYFIAAMADDQGEPQRALSYYKRVTGGEYHLSAQARAAELYALQGNDQRAMALVTSLKRDFTPDDVPVLLHLSESKVHRKAQRFDQALAAVDQALAKEPDSIDLRYHRAIIAESAGRLDVFEQELRRILAMDSENAHALNALGYHFIDTNQRLDEAESLIQRALKILPNDPAIIDSLGWLRYRQGRLDEAVTHLERAYGLLKDPEIAAHLVEVLRAQGRSGVAQRVLDDARRRWQAAPTLQAL